MSLESVWLDLTQEVEGLRQEMTILHTAIQEDSPAGEEVILIDLLADASLDALNLINQSLDYAAQGLQAVSGGAILHFSDLARADRALSDCGAQLADLSDSMQSRLLDVDRILELVRYGRQRGGEWQPWSLSVKDTLSRIPQRLTSTQRAVLACWQELLESTLRNTHAN